MAEEYHLRNSSLMFGIIWPIGTILIYFVYLKQQPKVTDIMYFKEMVLAVSLAIIVLIILFLHYKRTLYFGETEIGLCWPLKGPEKQEVKYEDIQKIIIEEKSGKEYLKSFIDDEEKKYKISLFTGKKIASDIKDEVFKKIKEKDIAVEVERG